MFRNQTTRTESGFRIEFEDQPFSSGSNRHCFRGKMILGPKYTKTTVIKVFKDKDLRQNYKIASEELKVYDVANDYAKMFNQSLARIGYQQTLSFPKPELVEIVNVNFFRRSNYFQIGDYACAQVYLNGQYTKFTNNVGFSAGEQIMEAFQHFSFRKSGNRVICCDLQGVKSKNRYLLTDPAVNSYNQMFGTTDMGREGMQEIIQRHRCNKICRKLGLETNTYFNQNLLPVWNSTSKRLPYTYKM